MVKITTMSGPQCKFLNETGYAEPSTSTMKWITRINLFVISWQTQHNTNSTQIHFRLQTVHLMASTHFKLWWRWAQKVWGQWQQPEDLWWTKLHMLKLWQSLFLAYLRLIANIPKRLLIVVCLDSGLITISTRSCWRWSEFMTQKQGLVMYSTTSITQSRGALLR